MADAPRRLSKRRDCAPYSLAIVTGFMPPQRRGKYNARQAAPKRRSHPLTAGHDIVFVLEMHVPW